MTTIKEDTNTWTSEECCYMPDADNKRGIDILNEANVHYVDREPYGLSDFGLSKNGAGVHGMPYNKTVLIVWEPAANIPGLDQAAKSGRFFNYLSCNADIGDPHHFTLCRGFNLIDKYFWKPRERLLCLISRNRNTIPGYESNDLYQYRREIVEDFTKRFSPEDFHIYGRWPASPHYKGELYSSNDLGGFGLECPINKGGDLRIDGRYEALPLYQYNVCCENSIGTGYITEKIFHAMAAGCIPVYKGGTQIDEMVPRDCYIDMRGKSLEEIYKEITSQTEADRTAMKERIYAWLKGDGNFWFGSPRFAKKILWAIGKGEPTR